MRVRTNKKYHQMKEVSNVEKAKRHVRIVVERGFNRRVVFREEVDAHNEDQLRQKAEAKMGSGFAVMSISRFSVDGCEPNNGKGGDYVVSK